MPSETVRGSLTKMRITLSGHSASHRPTHSEAASPITT